MGPWCWLWLYSPFGRFLFRTPGPRGASVFVSPGSLASSSSSVSSAQPVSTTARFFMRMHARTTVRVCARATAASGGGTGATTCGGARHSRACRGQRLLPGRTIIVPRLAWLYYHGHGLRHNRNRKIMGRVFLCFKNKNGTVLGIPGSAEGVLFIDRGCGTWCGGGQAHQPSRVLAGHGAPAHVHRSLALRQQGEAFTRMTAWQHNVIPRLNGFGVLL